MPITDEEEAEKLRSMQMCLMFMGGLLYAVALV